MNAALAQSRWAGWDAVQIAGDASPRRYYRLRHGQETAILMDDAEGGAAALTRFTTIADILRNRGLAAPETFALAPDDGLMIVTDMGGCSLSQEAARTPALEPDLYSAAIDVLITLHKTPAPDGLDPLTPERGAEMIAPLAEYYAPGLPDAPIKAALHHAMQTHCQGGLILAHRDYHADNLVWRADKTGLMRIGLLDFQDAIAAPPAYDMTSLLRDARRDVSPALRHAMIEKYCDATQTDLGPFMACFATLGVQRNLRIMGIFAHLAKARNKPGYLNLLPRIWQHLTEDLAHPGLSDLAAACAPIPAPTPAYLKGLLHDA